LLTCLEARLGARHAGARLAKERRIEAAKARGGLRAKLAPSHVLDTVGPWALRLSGMPARGGVNACRIEVRRNPIALRGLPDAFDGFTLLHLTDLHADISVGAMRALPAVIAGLDYDICVITGDFRGKTFGPHRRAMELIGDVLRDISKPVYGVLGNHDPATMLLGLEAMGVRMLMNEAEPLARDQDRLWIVGIDDPHFFNAFHRSAAVPGPVAEYPGANRAPHTDPNFGIVVEDVGTVAMLLCIVDGQQIVGVLQCLGELAHEVMAAAGNSVSRHQQVRITSCLCEV